MYHLVYLLTHVSKYMRGSSIGWFQTLDLENNKLYKIAHKQKTAVIVGCIYL